MLLSPPAATAANLPRSIIKKQKTEERLPRYCIIKELSKVPLVCEEEESIKNVTKNPRSYPLCRKLISLNNMDTIVNIVGGNPGGRAKYFLNDETTVKKLKAAADKIAMKVPHNSGSKKIEFRTGAYVSVVLPLIKTWQEGQPIHPTEVDGLDISVVKIEIEKDLGGTILL